MKIIALSLVGLLFFALVLGKLRSDGKIDQAENSPSAVLPPESIIENDLPDTSKLLATTHQANSEKKFDLAESKRKINESMARIAQSQLRSELVALHVNKRHKAFEDLYTEWQIASEDITEINDIIRDKHIAILQAYSDLNLRPEKRIELKNSINYLSYLKLEHILGADKAKQLLEVDEQERKKSVAQGYRFLDD